MEAARSHPQGLAKIRVVVTRVVIITQPCLFCLTPARHTSESNSSLPLTWHAQVWRITTALSSITLIAYWRLSLVDQCVKRESSIAFSDCHGKGHTGAGLERGLPVALDTQHSVTD